MSSLETAICYTVVLLVLSALILLPMKLCADTLFDANSAIEDVLDDTDGFISAERLNTFLVGLSENYRIIYGTILGEADDE